MKDYLFAVLLLFFAGCSQGEKGGEEPEPTPEIREIPIHLNLKVGDLTKATDTGYESGDRIGLYVVNYKDSNPGELLDNGNHADNICFTYTTEWTPQQEIYWKDETTKADFYCYYPYASVSDVSHLTFTVQADQSSEVNYRASDFLWGKTTGVSPTESDVAITTHHVFSNMQISLEAGDGFTAESLAAAQVEVKINHIRIQATVDLSTGIATPAGEERTITPWKDGDYYRALIIPQSVDADDFVVVRVNGKDYSLKKAFTFVANKRHKFTIRVNKTSNGINVGIGQWEEDDIDNGGTAE